MGVYDMVLFFVFQKTSTDHNTIHRAVHAFIKTLAGEHVCAAFSRLWLRQLAYFFVSHANSGAVMCVLCHPFDAVQAHSIMVDDSLDCHYDVYHAGLRLKGSKHHERLVCSHTVRPRMQWQGMFWKVMGLEASSCCCKCIGYVQNIWVSWQVAKELYAGEFFRIVLVVSNCKNRVCVAPFIA